MQTNIIFIIVLTMFLILFKWFNNNLSDEIFNEIQSQKENFMTKYKRKIIIVTNSKFVLIHFKDLNNNKNKIYKIYKNKFTKSQIDKLINL